eukprot:UN10408
MVAAITTSSSSSLSNNDLQQDYQYCNFTITVGYNQLPKPTALFPPLCGTTNNPVYCRTSTPMAFNFNARYIDYPAQILFSPHVELLSTYTPRLLYAQATYEVEFSGFYPDSIIQIRSE